MSSEAIRYWANWTVVVGVAVTIIAAIAEKISPEWSWASWVSIYASAVALVATGAIFIEVGLPNAP